MQLSAILLARVIALFEVADITPPGGFFFPELVKEVVQRFNFQKSPTNFEEWTSKEGTLFASGRSGKVTIDSLKLFRDGIQLETHTGTAESKKIIEEMLEWGKEKFGFSFKEGFTIRWAYVSDLTFLTDVEILSTPPLRNLAEQTTRAISEIVGTQLPYVPTMQTIGHDSLVLKHGRASLSIQRRLDVPFSDNKYFSEAPLPTDVHIKLLEQFEADVKATFGNKTTGVGGVRR